MPTTSNPTLTWYVFDGDLLIGEVGTPYAVGGGGGMGGGGLDVLDEVQGMAGPYVPQQGTAVVGVAYTWGAAGLVSARTNPNNVEGASYWYHFGPQGETRYLSGAAGAPVAYTQYSGYGIASGGLAASSGFNFGGQFGYYTDYAGILCGARWYDPAMGRWMSRDPIGFGGGPNLYEYCLGSPLRFVDPLGTVYTFLGLRRGTWAGIGSGIGTFLLTGNPLLATGVGMGARAFVNSRDDGDSLGMAAFNGIGNFCLGYVSAGLAGEAVNGLRAFLAWRAAAAGGAAITVASRAGPQLAVDPTEAPGACAEGEFSISNWSGYPEGMPKPSGPFRVVAGEEYGQARAAANASNATLKRMYPEFRGFDIHEWHPVKFGGSPTDISNKYPLTPTEHAQLTNFWNKLLRSIPR